MEKLMINKQQLDNNEFTLFYNAIAFGVLIVDPEGKILFANNSAKDIFAQNIPDNYRNLLQDEKHAFIHAVDNCLLHQTINERQVAIDDRTYLITCQPVFNELEFCGCVVSLTDITDTASAERLHGLLYQISSGLSVAGPGNLQAVLAIAASQILRFMNVTSTNIMLINRQTNELIIEVDTNKSDPSYQPRRFKLGEGIAGKAAIELRPFSVYDVKASDIYCQKRPSDKGALLSVPIAVKGKLLGVINVHSKQPRYFTEDEVQFLSIVANEIGIAIENNFLYYDLNRKIDLLSELSRTSSLFGSRTIDARIQRLVRITAQLVEAEGCYIYLYSASKRKFFLRYRNGANVDVPTEINEDDAKKSATLRMVFNEQKTIVVNNIETEHANPTALKKVGIRNFISAPLYVGEKPVGVISVFNKTLGGFTEEDEQLLGITTHRIATKMENMELSKKLHSEKEVLDKTIQNINDGVLVLNRRRKIVIWNNYMESMTGIPAEDAIGQQAYKILYNQLGLKKLTELIYSDIPASSPETCTAEERLTNVNEERFWVESSISHILTDDHKSIENTIIVIRNISEEKEFIDAKNEFVSLTTHELRTPLTAIKGYLSMALANGGKNPANEKKYINKAYQSTERLVELVEELLEVVRIDENRIEIQPEIFAIGEIIEESIEELSQKAAGKNISFRYRAGLPIFVFGDKPKTKQVIENLIDNAIKYTRSNGTISLGLEKREHELLISIKDTGVGIPQRYQDSIFERFVRVDNPLSVKAGGTGLGLYIVKSLVERQGGKIWVKSDVGKGTTFYFTLPLANKPTAVPNNRKEQS